MNTDYTDKARGKGTEQRKTAYTDAKKYRAELRT